MGGRLTNSEAMHEAVYEGQKESSQGFASERQETLSLAVDAGGARPAGKIATLSRSTSSTPRSTYNPRGTLKETEFLVCC